MNNTNTFNKRLGLCLKDCKLIENKNIDLEEINEAMFKTEKEYQNSFDNIIKFSKTIKDKEKKEINAIIYHDQNKDGLFSALVFWQFLNENNLTSDNIVYIPLKPSSGNKVNFRLNNILGLIKDKNVLIVDIQYSYINLKLISENCKKLYIIDDHPREEGNIKQLETINNLKGNIFIGNDHAACAYTWKFFFPKKDVPLYIQVTDNNDLKMQLPFLQSYSRSIDVVVEYRVVHSPYIKSFNNNQSFKKLNEIIQNLDLNLFYVIGKYYDEVANNIKEQVAQNAVVQPFQGYKVTVLNWNDPALTKMVLRQMISNAENKGLNVDFAICWGYEYTANAYRIQLSEKHTGGNPKYNLPIMAEKLGKFFGSSRGGGGKRFLGNFYLPRGKYDIWDLFVNSDEILKKAGFRK